MDLCNLYPGCSSPCHIWTRSKGVVESGPVACSDIGRWTDCGSGVLLGCTLPYGNLEQGGTVTLCSPDAFSEFFPARSRGVNGSKAAGRERRIWVDGCPSARGKLKARWAGCLPVEVKLNGNRRSIHWRYVCFVKASSKLVHESYCQASIFDVGFLLGIGIVLT
jgi:hypothetical protein